MNKIEEQAERLVWQNVYYCVSSLVSTLASGYGLLDGYSESRARMRDQAGSLVDLTEQAAELCASVQDYEEAARSDGFEVRHDINGFYWCSQDEAAHEDEGNPSAGFDGRAHYDTIETAARECCADNGLDPYEWEIFEHWLVSDWLVEKLEAAGERVGRDFAGMTIWGRTTTGQGVASDSVIEAIAKEMTGG